jgi:tetratricopeptide (TPR) repeat protein
MTIRLRTLIATLALVAGTANAGPKQKEAKKHIDKATKLHADGKYDEALVELQAAYKLDPKPDLLFAIGQVHAKLGQCNEATENFKKFAKAKKKKEIEAVVEEAIKECKPADAPPPPEPTPTPTPTPTPSVTTSPTPEPTPTPTPTPEPTPPPDLTPAPAPIVQQPPPPPPSAHHWYQDKVGDALVVGGAVGIIGGIVEYQAAKSDLDSAESATSLAGYRSQVDSAHSARTVSVVLGVGGLVLVGGGVIHYVISGRAEPSGVAAAPTKGGAMITWSGGF